MPRRRRRARPARSATWIKPGALRPVADQAMAQRAPIRPRVRQAAAPGAGHALGPPDTVLPGRRRRSRPLRRPRHRGGPYRAVIVPRDGQRWCARPVAPPADPPRTVAPPSQEVPAPSSDRREVRHGHVGRWGARRHGARQLDLAAGAVQVDACDHCVDRWSRPALDEIGAHPGRVLTPALPSLQPISNRRPSHRLSSLDCAPPDAPTGAASPPCRRCSMRSGYRHLQRKFSCSLI